MRDHSPFPILFKVSEVLEIDDDDEQVVDITRRSTVFGGLSKPPCISDENGPLDRFGRRRE